MDYSYTNDVTSLPDEMSDVFHEPESYKLKTGIIVLDFDGVVTSTHETPGSYINHDGDDYGISKGCLDRLIRLARDCNAKFVISSNWRRFPDDGFWHHPRGDFKNNLPKLKKLLGELWWCDLPKDRHITKSEALELWFEDLGEDWKSYRMVILDDDPREGFASSKFAKHYLQMKSEDGFTEEDLTNAKKILGESK